MQKSAECVHCEMFTSFSAWTFGKAFSFACYFLFDVGEENTPKLFTWKARRRFVGNSDGDDHQTGIQPLSTKQGAVNKSQSFTLLANRECHRQILKRGIKSANKGRKYGCVLKLKASAAACDHPATVSTTLIVISQQTTWKPLYQRLVCSSR